MIVYQFMYYGATDGEWSDEEGKERIEQPIQNSKSENALSSLTVKRPLDLLHFR